MILLLSSCFGPTTLSSTINYYVTHDVTWDDDLCVGGLKGKLSLGETVMFESLVIPLGENYEESKLRGSIDRGAPVLAEAWCYGLENEQLGYIVAKGMLVASYGAGVAYTEPQESPFCFTGETQGNVIPCISSSIIEQ